MKCIDLKKEFGDRFVISHDPAVDKVGTDPWYHIIPCSKGHIYPSGEGRLGVWIEDRAKAIRMRKEISGLTTHVESSMEVILLFPIELFEQVAKAMGAVELKYRRAWLAEKKQGRAA